MPSQVSYNGCLDNHFPRRNFLLHRYIKLFGVGRTEAVVHGKHRAERVIGEVIVDGGKRGKSVANALPNINIAGRSAQRRSKWELPEQPQASSFTSGGVVEQTESGANDSVR